MTGLVVNWNDGLLGPRGEDVAVKVAFPLKPILPTEIVEVLAVPATTFVIVGLAPMMKSPVTITLSTAIWTRVPVFACIVIE